MIIDRKKPKECRYHPNVLLKASGELGEQMEPVLYVLQAVSHEASSACSENPFLAPSASGPKAVANFYIFFHSCKSLNSLFMTSR